MSDWKKERENSKENKEKELRMREDRVKKGNSEVHRKLIKENTKKGTLRLKRRLDKNVGPFKWRTICSFIVWYLSQSCHFPPHHRTLCLETNVLKLPHFWLHVVSHNHHHYHHVHCSRNQFVLRYGAAFQNHLARASVKALRFGWAVWQLAYISSSTPLSHLVPLTIYRPFRDERALYCAEPLKYYKCYR